ncbi:MAG: acetyl-CoA C-acyltransferase [Elusimicrobia bacterium CG_4_10_14_0_2_um_filter_56_8]|nr:MAG: acetyl-CoA acetyltransferase [Elusimicrobia bacterium CG1_02_56_21]PJA16186.1 MAG: acetyl-CoA C-acyltransferase [Elusimicrobia bacterium CG_4_10_14_0_2_um_filter_56_8]
MEQDIFVVDALRTPFGSLGGALSEVEAPRLAGAVIQGLLASASLPPEAVGEVIMGQVLSGGAGQAPARQAAISGGLPPSVPAMTINKVCGSGLKAIMLGAGSIALKEAGVVIAGGMENMSLAPYFLKKARSGYRLGNGELLDMMIHDGLWDPYTGRHMGQIGEESAAKHSITRAQQDEFAARSYRLAQDAIKNGVFKAEIVPFVKESRKGPVTVSEDEEPLKVDFEKIDKLRPVFKKDGTITAANASTINDGAAVAMLASWTAVKEHNLKPKARIVATATSSLSPELFPEAPVEAIKKVCEKAKLKISEIDLFEINEAFAAVTLLAVKQLGLDIDRVNVNGGAAAIGHALGASGARLAATLVRELGRRKARYGLATLCIGGGEAVAVIFERV